MAAEASIAMSVRDNLSSAIVSMRNSLTAFRRDTTELGAELDRLSNRRLTLRLNLDQATAEARQARQEMQRLAREGASAAEQAAAEDAWRRAELNLQSIREEYNLVGRQVRETTRDFENASDAIRRAENRAGSGGRRSGDNGNHNDDDSGSSSILSALSQAGLIDMVGDVASEWANSLVGSAFGDETGTLFSSGLGGLASGAAMGSLAGPIGTAVGAAVGGALGLLSGGNQLFQEQDDVFKTYYAGQYNAAQEATAQSITSGSSIASGRESDLISFSTLFGDQDTAQRYLSDLVDMSNRTPFLYDDLTAMSKTLATYGYSQNEILPVLQAVGDAGAALGMGVSDMSAVATGLGRMKSSNKASLEYLNILNERGIGAIGYLAEAKGLTVGETYDKISKGEISGTEAVDIILEALSRDKENGGFAGAMLEQSQTFAGLTSTLEGLKQEVDNAAGEGYNKERVQGLQSEIDAYGGALGEAMSNLNTISGETQALLDNLKDQYQREALSAVLLGDQSGELFTGEDRALLDQLRAEYIDASAAYEESVQETGQGNLEAGMKMEALKEQAIALAAVAFDSSQEVQTLQDVTLEQIAATRELTAAFDGWANSDALDDELNKGLAAGWSAGAWSSSRAGDGVAEPTEFFTSGPSSSNEPDLLNSNAFGLERVPYDGYPAMLHEGERVLTARDARAQDRISDLLIGRNQPALSGSGAAEPASASISITVSGNTFGAGLDEAAVAQALADQIVLQLKAGGGR